MSSMVSGTGCKYPCVDGVAGSETKRNIKRPSCDDAEVRRKQTERLGATLMKRIVVIGAGGMAREVKWLISEINCETQVAFSRLCLSDLVVDAA